MYSKDVMESVIHATLGLTYEEFLKIGAGKKPNKSPSLWGQITEVFPKLGRAALPKTSELQQPSTISEPPKPLAAQLGLFSPNRKELQRPSELYAEVHQLLGRVAIENIKVYCEKFDDRFQRLQKKLPTGKNRFKPPILQTGTAEKNMSEPLALRDEAVQYLATASTASLASPPGEAKSTDVHDVNKLFAEVASLAGEVQDNDYELYQQQYQVEFEKFGKFNLILNDKDIPGLKALQKKLQEHLKNSPEKSITYNF